MYVHFWRLDVRGGFWQWMFEYGVRFHQKDLVLVDQRVHLTKVIH